MSRRTTAKRTALTTSLVMTRPIWHLSRSTLRLRFLLSVLITFRRTCWARRSSWWATLLVTVARSVAGFLARSNATLLWTKPSIRGWYKRTLQLIQAIVADRGSISLGGWVGSALQKR